MGHLSFAITPVSLLFGVAAAALTLWLSVRLARRVKMGRALAGLEALRLLVVLLIVLTLMRPEYVQRIRRFREPEIVILGDQSRSMQTRDVAEDDREPVTRADWLKDRTDPKFWSALQPRYKVAIEGFAAPPADGNPPDAPRPDEGTDLGAALADALGKHPNMRSLVLLSDGDWNMGSPPAGAATRLRAAGVPVFCVAVGSDSPLPDLELQDVKAPAFCLLGEHVSIPYTIRSHLSRDVRTRVSLASESGVEAARDVVIPARALFQDAILWRAKALGEYTLTLSLPVEPEEKLAFNNQRVFHISVRTETLKVLVVETRPRWEYRYLRNALVRDPGVEVRCLLLHPGLKPGGGSDYIPSFPDTKEKIGQYDVVFLGDIGVGPGELTPRDLELVRGLVENQGSGLVFLPGSQGRELSLEKSPVGDLLPIVFDPARPNGISLNVESKLLLTSYGQDHLLTMLADNASSNRMIWRQLPGFYWCAGVLRARPGSRTLAVHGTMRNQYGQIPLLVTRPFGSGLVLFMGTDSAWRWRKGVEDLYHYRFWGQVVRWMAHKRHMAQQRGVRLFYTPENPAIDEKIFFQATLLDAGGLPVENDKVTLEIEHRDRKQQIDLLPEKDGWGTYQGAFIPTRGGRYALRLEGRRSGRRLETEMTVAAPVREKVGQPARYGVLREIARLTDGEFLTTADAGSVVEKIAALPEQVYLEKRLRIWCQWWWGALIILLATAYWVARKMMGMI